MVVVLVPDPVHAPTPRHSLAVRTALAWDPVPKVMPVKGSVALGVRTETFYVLKYFLRYLQGTHLLPSNFTEAAGYI